MRALLLLTVVAAAVAYPSPYPYPRPQESECNQFCPLDYLPICGINSDGYLKTFGNPCFLKVENDCNGGDYEYLYCGICNTRTFTARR
ncbi:vasotab-like [Macrosteles quadrilineatus]|uniref:vasotab-like n=1 Tax=Macrosteles quadrilineatus TaxID=74068 RepID=UPI0023E18137|nr:vasotab-like [Macrosteles quadrilineatus]